MAVRRRGGWGMAGAGAAANINDFLTKKWSADEVTKRGQELAKAQHLNSLEDYQMKNPDPEVLKKLLQDPKDAEMISPELMGQMTENFARSRGMQRPDQSTWQPKVTTTPGAEGQLPSTSYGQTTPMKELMDRSQQTLTAQKAQVGAFNDRQNRENPVNVESIGPGGEKVSTPQARGSAGAYQPSVGRTNAQEQALETAKAAGTQQGNIPTPATIAGKVNEFNALTPGAVSRSGQSAGADESARIAAGAKEKARTEGVAAGAKSKEALIADVAAQEKANDEELSHQLALAQQQAKDAQDPNVAGQLVRAAMAKHAQVVQRLQKQKQAIIMGQPVDAAAPAAPEAPKPAAGGMPAGVTVRRVK